MAFHVELTDEETLCLHRYFERVDETEDLTFLDAAEHRAFQRIASQVCKASTAALKFNCDKLLDVARRALARGFGGDIQGPMAGSRTDIRLATSRSEASLRGESSRSGGGQSASLRFRAETLALDCQAGFEADDLERLTALFARDARIVSPFLGCLTAREFLSKVVAPSGGARLTLHDVLTNIEGRPQARGYFLYGGWQMPARETSAERQGVFNYALNIDGSACGIRSMIIL